MPDNIGSLCKMQHNTRCSELRDVEEKYEDVDLNVALHHQQPNIPFYTLELIHMRRDTHGFATIEYSFHDFVDERFLRREC
jgi:hypothetical protein